jgi:hypothetical protein
MDVGSASVGDALSPTINGVETSGAVAQSTTNGLQQVFSGKFHMQALSQVQVLET